MESSLLSESAPITAGLAAEPVDSGNVFLYHKTTERDTYERAREQRLECDDVILWNERGELTESTVANVVLEMGGTYWTPPVDAGLLAGCFRQHLLEAGIIAERTLTKENLEQADRVWLINSVRRWMPVKWVSCPEAASGVPNKQPDSTTTATR